MVGVNAGVQDAHGHLRTGDVDLLGLDRADGVQAPRVRVALVGREVGVALGGEVIELGVGRQAVVMVGHGLGDRLVLAGGALVLIHLDLGAAHRGVARGADGVVGDPGGDQGSSEIGREGGLHRLHEEGVENRVLGEDHSAHVTGFRNSRCEIRFGSANGQVHGIIHDLVALPRG